MTDVGRDDKKGALLNRLVRGFLAGAAGGLVGGGAKLLGELVFPPRAPGEPVPPIEAFSRIAQFLSGHPLLPEHHVLATQLFHWPFSIFMAAGYGLLVEVVPWAKVGRGAVFGIVLCLATHESLLPALGLSLPLREIPFKEHASELLTHALYGFCAEMVRRTLRKHVLNGEPERVA